MRGFYVVLITIFQCVIYSLQSTDELRSVLEVSAGIYTNESRLLEYPSFSGQLRKSVILTAANNAYHNHLHNFMCFMERLGMKSLVLSLDDSTHSFVQSYRTKDGNVQFLSYRLRGKDIVFGYSANFRSPQFHVMSMLKIEGALQVLKQGYDVFFVDPDIAVIRDPIPYILFKNVDYIHSINLRCNMPNSTKWDFYKSEEEGNTGLYYLRSNVNTINLLTKTIAKAPSMRHYDDQTIFWKGLRNGEFGMINPLPDCVDFDATNVNLNTIVTCPLDGCQFSPGALPDHNDSEMYKYLLEGLKSSNKSLISVHANYIIGNNQKMDALKKRGFWISKWPVKLCNAYTRNFP